MRGTQRKEANGESLTEPMMVFANIRNIVTHTSRYRFIFHFRDLSLMLSVNAIYKYFINHYRIHSPALRREQEGRTSDAHCFAWSKEHKLLLF